MPVPVSGSTVPMLWFAAIVIGADHVAPLSAERMMRNRMLGAPTFASSVKNSTSMPSGSTTIWLLIVWALGSGS